ncbi:FCD domain-containing protein [Mucilaginibacter kameinonensis]|uniref:FCD domain-containing protein n=1 Tax=Mucilaginibacter kameinonensis TaxID=452286 RepID=UPI001ABFB5DB|nr:FCD domain-containing protein [Mucilaginibacter kameinonensis]
MNTEVLDKSTLKEIFEMRLALEIGMVDFVIERVKPEDIAELRAIVSVKIYQKILPIDINYYR